VNTNQSRSQKLLGHSSTGAAIHGKTCTRPSHSTRNSTNDTGRNAAEASAMRRTGWLQRAPATIWVAANSTPACDRPVQNSQLTK